MVDHGARKETSSSQELKLARKKAFLKEQQRLAELEWEKNQGNLSDDATLNHVPETQLEETQTTRILTQIHESPSSSCQPTPGISRDSESDNESASEIETPSRHVRSRKDLAAEVQVIDGLQPGSHPEEEPKKEKKKAPYKMRKNLASRMGLQPSDNIGIRERRDYLRMLCARRSQPLTKPFNKFDQNVMYKLIKIVAPEMREQFGNCWTSKLTRDVIHALCLDKVRNYNARERLLAEKARLSRLAEEARLSEEGNDIPAGSDTHDNRQVPEDDSDKEEVVDSEEESMAAFRKRAPGTIPKTPSIHHRPSNKPNPPQHSEPRSYTAKQSAPKQKSRQTTTHTTEDFLAATPVTKGDKLPLNPTPITNESALEVISPMTIMNISRSERASSSISSAPMFREKQAKESQNDISEILSIYIANNKPIRMPIIRGFKGFMAAISSILTIGDSDIAYYRPADGPPKALIWRPISIEEDFSRLLDLCGDGVLVKVVTPNDDEFNSEDEEPRNVVELPVTSKTWNKKNRYTEGLGKANNFHKTKKGNRTGSEVQINPPFPVHTPNGAELSTQPNSGGPESEQGKGKRKADKEAPIPELTVKKRPRGRPRKEKPAATPDSTSSASHPTLTPAPASPMATTRAGRATRMTEKASETAAIKATKKQVEHIANVRRDIRNQKANFKIQ